MKQGSVREILLYFAGPILIGSLGLFIHFSEYVLIIPSPAPFLILIITLICFYGHFRAGLLASVMAWLYMLYFHSQSGPLDNETYNRIVMWAVAFPGNAFLISFLRSRSEEVLRKEIQERILREEALRNSEERVRAMLTSAHDAFVAIDEKSSILEWNPQAEKNFGWSREEVLGRSLVDVLIPMQHQKAHLEGMQNYLTSGEGPILNRRIEVPAKHRLGHELMVELTVYPIHQDKVVMFGAFLHDISERKKSEQFHLIQYSVSRIMTEESSLSVALSRILKSIAMPLNWPLVEIWLCDQDRKFLKCAGLWALSFEMDETLRNINSTLEILSAEGLFGANSTFVDPSWFELKEQVFPRSDLLKKNGIRTILQAPLSASGSMIGVLCLYHTSALPRDQKVMELANDLSHQLSLFVLRFWAEQDLKDLSKELEIKVQNRTEQLESLNKELSREVAEKQILYQEAQRANKLKDEFLATISHELRTPTNVIMGHGELLYEGQSLSDDEKIKSVEAIYRNAKAQVRIVSDILDVSRFITGKLHLNVETVDIAEIISLSVESIMPAASAKDIEVNESMPNDAGTVLGDPTRLQQVMWNLLSNAVKFTPRKGKIYVSLARSGSGVTITVQDTGKGIDPSFLPYVFERFRQEDSSTTRTFGGLGLGLAIARSIVEAHGGSIQAASEGRGKGATFTVNLPISSIRTGTVGDRQNKQTFKLAKEPLKGFNILVVDDQADALILVATILKKAGAHVLTASSVAEAFKSVIKNRPQVVVTDIGMPEQDGYDLVHMIRKLPPEMGGQTTVIALTAYAHEEDHNRAIREGFDEHLAKPVESHKLIQTIYRLKRLTEKPH